MNGLLMGVPGVGEVHPGAHVCALFSGQVQRDRILLPFLQEGLRHGDQCVCLIDDLEHGSMRERAFEPATDGDTLRPGRLDAYAAPDAYIHAGALSAHHRISDLVSHPMATPGRGRPLLRAAAQMPPGASPESDSAEFLAYEAAVTLILATLPAILLCLYDVRLLGAGLLTEVLKVHSRILIDGALLYNPHLVTPPVPVVSEIPLSDRSKANGSRDGLADADPWRSLTGAEARIAGLVGAGMSNRATAAELIVSPHTVDAHLKHIYQKLGIHSRTQLAVLSFRHGSPLR